MKILGKLKLMTASCYQTENRLAMKKQGIYWRTLWLLACVRQSINRSFPDLVN